ALLPQAVHHGETAGNGQDRLSLLGPQLRLVLFDDHDIISSLVGDRVGVRSRWKRPFDFPILLQAASPATRWCGAAPAPWRPAWCHGTRTRQPRRRHRRRGGGAGGGKGLWNSYPPLLRLSLGAGIVLISLAWE